MKKRLKIYKSRPSSQTKHNPNSGTKAHGTWKGYDGRQGAGGVAGQGQPAKKANERRAERKEILQIKRKLIYYVNRKAWRSHIRMEGEGASERAGVERARGKATLKCYTVRNCSWPFNWATFCSPAPPLKVAKYLLWQQRPAEKR